VQENREDVMQVSERIQSIPLHHVDEDAALAMQLQGEEDGGAILDARPASMAEGEAGTQVNGVEWVCVCCKGKGEDETELAQCSGCDSVWHMHCIDPRRRYIASHFLCVDCKVLAASRYPSLNPDRPADRAELVFALQREKNRRKVVAVLERMAQDELRSEEDLTMRATTNVPELVRQQNLALRIANRQQQQQSQHLHLQQQAPVHSILREDRAGTMAGHTAPLTANVVSQCPSSSRRRRNIERKMRLADAAAAAGGNYLSSGHDMHSRYHRKQQAPIQCPEDEDGSVEKRVSSRPKGRGNSRLQRKKDVVDSDTDDDNLMEEGACVFVVNAESRPQQIRRPSRPLQVLNSASIWDTMRLTGADTASETRKMASAFLGSAAARAGNEAATGNASTFSFDKVLFGHDPFDTR
jgi:hypothetical protein